MMFNNYIINEVETIQFQPQQALIFYKSTKGGDDYIELRKISKSTGKMLSGKPLTKKFLSQLVETFSFNGEKEEPEYPHGIVPGNMLYFDFAPGSKKYIWYNPPQKRKMYFTEAFTLPDAEYSLPGLVYLTHGESLKIYAYKGKKLTPDSRLYRAPFFNVGGASVCLGNATSKIKKPTIKTFANIIEYWENLFWLSRFSHIGTQPTKDNLIWVLKNSTESFDHRQLLPSISVETKRQRTLKDLFK